MGKDTGIKNSTSAIFSWSCRADSQRVGKRYFNSCLREAGSKVIMVLSGGIFNISRASSLLGEFSMRSKRGCPTQVKDTPLAAKNWASWGKMAKIWSVMSIICWVFCGVGDQTQAWGAI